ncbi:MAG: ABC transporter permease [Vulcanimicrobiota bacterium]
MAHRIIAFLKEPWELIYFHRRMLWAVYVSDLRLRFAAGNILGWAWLILYPLLFLGAYSLLYVGLLSVRLPNMNSTEYILLIFVGFVVWWSISEVISAGIGLIHSNVNILQNTLFPIDMLAVRVTIVAKTQMIVSLALILMAYSIVGKCSISWLQIILLLVIQSVAEVGIAWILATLGAFFKDLIQVTSVILMLMLLLTPIGYAEDMVSGRLRLITSLNPATYMIRAYRDCISYSHFSHLSLILTLIAGALILYYFGYFIFSRLKGVFANLV